MTTRLAGRRKRLSFAIVAAVLGLAGAAHAQPNAGAGRALIGRWEFETDVATEFACVVRGNATLTPVASGRYVVQMSTVEECRVGEVARSVQYCNAVQRANAVQVTCSLVRVSHRDYLPDDFVLRVTSPDAMQGEIVSSWNAPARWRRPHADLVS